MGECTMCGGGVPDERVDMGYDYCIPCANAHPELSRPEFGVIGQHKGPPLVISVRSPEWLANQSAMRR